MRFWPTNVRTRRVTVAEGDEVAAGVYGMLDRAWARGMNGHTGAVRIGTSSDPQFRFNGYVDYALLALTSTMGASRNLRGRPNVAMPATAGPIVVRAPSQANTPVMNVLAAAPPGFR